MSNNLTVVIHTYNEEHNIVECITSAQTVTSSIVVIDMESTDKTVELAQSLGIQTVTFPFSYYVEPARAFGIQQAPTDWVLILDADERVTPELATEVQTITSGTISTGTTYYKIPRRNIFGRIKWLRYGGWWPDHQMRLINKLYLKNWPKEIHSTPQIEGKMGYLQNPMLHYFHGDIKKMVDKTVIFENIEATLLFNAGRAVSTPTFFRKFFGELFRRLIKHAGFMDGTVGIIECIYQAFSKTITWLYVYEKKINSTV